ncbi:hypothetical protein PN441_05285 [Spirulina major CS-329]|uniref:hypothetical protein n=1 Tax=Spirulina TaxID=1154 RepID=UPI00232FA89A|nr:MULTISPECIES: hypothetical protein [Spirulina]MDB9496566.1 hypothetical protein [Spirulina subsalsa CS-330]MDB9502478.1 hypothetical protein [Spirulina major CS-329]
MLQKNFATIVVSLSHLTIAGIFHPASSQVSSLSIQSFDLSNNSITLTNSRGVFVLPNSVSLDVTVFVSFGSQVMFDSANWGPLDSSDNIGTVTLNFDNTGPGVLLATSPFEYTISGFDNSGNPVSAYSSQWSIYGLSNEAIISSIAGSAQVPSNTRGLLRDENNGQQFPNGFQFTPPPFQTAIAPGLNTSLAPIPSETTIAPSLNTSLPLLPENTTQPGTTLLNSRPTPNQRAFRPNGVHPRIVPAGSPGRSLK